MDQTAVTAGSKTLHLRSHSSVNTSKYHILKRRVPIDELGLSIHTDYESVFPQGIHREYWLNITDKVISPDGYLKTEGKVINGSYPGPLIEACWGDDITVHVTNYLKTNGSTIHWHGLRQLHTNEADGVNGVTQCPIADGDTFDYKFKALQYGHSWYHSHYSLQYPDGVAGPLLIHGPSSANWDKAWTPILISDWSHRSAFQDFYVELGNSTSGVLGREPTMQSIVLNGTGIPRIEITWSFSG